VSDTSISLLLRLPVLEDLHIWATNISSEGIALLQRQQTRDEAQE
jgi:hypothetical protein